MQLSLVAQVRRGAKDERQLGLVGRQRAKDGVILRLGRVFGVGIYLPKEVDILVLQVQIVALESHSAGDRAAVCNVQCDGRSSNR